MSSKPPTAVKPSTPTTVKPPTVPKTPTHSMTSAINKTPTKSPTSERAASFVTPRASGPHATSSSSSSSDGSGSPTHYRKRAAKLGVECPELTYIADLQDYKIGESMIDCDLQIGDVIGPKMERSGVMYTTCFTNEGHIAKIKAFAPVSVELEKIAKNHKVVSFQSLHATEPYIKDKHNSPLPFELLYKHDSSAKGYMSDGPLPTKTIENFEDLKDGDMLTMRVTKMQYFRPSTKEKGKRNYGARVVDRHNNRAELTMSFDNDENALKFEPGRVIILKGTVSIKQEDVIKIKSRVEDIQVVETAIENVPRLSQTHTPKKQKLAP